MPKTFDELLSLFPRGSGEFSETFEAFNIEWGKMLQFQTIVRMGIPPTEAKFSEKILELVSEMRPGKQFGNLLIDSETFFNEGKDKEMAISGARQAVAHSLSVAESMTLMWGHTIFENSLQRFLQIILEISPTSFYKRVNNQKVTIEQVSNFKLESILQERVTNFVKGLENESIPVKCDELLLILGSGHEEYSPKNFKYDREMISNINMRRHDVAHGRNLSLTNSQVDGDLDYLYRAFGYFLFLMHERFDLKISGYPNMIQALKKRDSDIE